MKGTKVVCVCVRHFGNDWLQLVEQRVDMERKFLEHSLLRSESSTGAKVPWNESSWNIRSPGANVPRNESSTGAKVLSMVCSLPGTKVQRNEKASYRFLGSTSINVIFAQSVKFPKIL